MKLSHLARQRVLRGSTGIRSGSVPHHRCSMQSRVGPQSSSRTVARATAADPASKYYDAIMLQGFGWDSCRAGGWWQSIGAKAQEIADAGFTHIWLPPPSQSVSEEGYLPSQLYNFNSKYGSEHDLRECLKALNEAGVKPVADLVFNHRCADTQDEDGGWTIFSGACEPDGVATCAWDTWAITSNDPEFSGIGSLDTGEDFHAAPDLDHTDERVQAGLSDFAKYLVENLGFQGLRFDFSKGYAGKYAGQYTRAAAGLEKFSVGEFWTPLNYDKEGKLLYDQSANRADVEEWIKEADGACCAFDFSTKGILQEAVEYNKYDWLVDEDNTPHGLLGIQPTRSITFVDNHDTGSTQAHWPFPKEKILEGYAYIMTHPGMPTVFWEHLYDGDEDLKAGIKTLVQMRKRAGVIASSKVTILHAKPEIYIAETVGSSGTLRIKMGPETDLGDYDLTGDAGWSVVLESSETSGSNFTIWEKK